jgi:hypothetical protein
MTNNPKLTPEESLIYTVSKVNLDNRDSVRLHDILKQDLDWSIIKRYARQLGVSPLLFKHLSKKGNARNVPDETMLSLRKSYVNHLGRSFKLNKEIEDILSIMNRSNIPVVLLKGAFLAKHIYGDIALRPMGDIDILVREGDSEIVQERLTEIGFKKSTSYHASNFHENLLNKEAGHLTPMYKPKACPVEIHFNTFAGFRYSPADMEAVWQTAEIANFNGFQMKCLSPEYQLIHLCLHLYNHAIPVTADIITFYWFCDIHEVVIHYKDKINWDTFCSITNTLGVITQVGTILSYIKHYWNTPIPETALHYPEKELNDRYLATAIRSILDGSKARRSHLHRYIKKTKLPLTQKTELNPFYYILKEIFPNRSNLLRRYGLNDSLLVYAYYIIHPCKLCILVVTSIFHNAVDILKNFMPGHRNH